MRYNTTMTKLIDCPICGETKPVRNDAKVCSPECRLKKWRAEKINKDNLNKTGEENEH